MLKKYQVPKDYVIGLQFGPYGRERSCLMTTFASGAVGCKILSRTSNPSTAPEMKVADSESDVIQIPKKSKTFLDQVQYERKNAVEMHKIFQRDLFKLRITTARTFIRMITKMDSPYSFSSETPLRLSVQVAGIGPIFKLKLHLENTGKRSVTDFVITFNYNHILYKILNPVIQVGTVMNIFLRLKSYQIPILIPNMVYQCEAVISVLKDAAGADNIRIFVCNQKHSQILPVITFVIAMPVSEFFLENL